MNFSYLRRLIDTLQKLLEDQLSVVRTDPSMYSNVLCVQACVNIRECNEEREHISSPFFPSPTTFTYFHHFKVSPRHVGQTCHATKLRHKANHLLRSLGREEQQMTLESRLDSTLPEKSGSGAVCVSSSNLCSYKQHMSTVLLVSSSLYKGLFYW